MPCVRLSLRVRTQTALTVMVGAVSCSCQRNSGRTCQSDATSVSEQEGTGLPSLDLIELIEDAKGQLVRVVGEGTFAAQSIETRLDDIAKAAEYERQDWEVTFDLLQEDDEWERYLL